MFGDVAFDAEMDFADFEPAGAQLEELGRLVTEGKARRCRSVCVPFVHLLAAEREADGRAHFKVVVCGDPQVRHVGLSNETPWGLMVRPKLWTWGSSVIP